MGRGTGLGLSMVYGFVKQSGGHIAIDSEPGRGTTIRIYLPRADYENPNGTAMTADTPPQQGTETILVVEDNEDVRKAVVARLVLLGYRTIEAENGDGALKILERGEPDVDLLFTDVTMPGQFDGYALAKLALERRPGIKVLLTTGFSGDALVRDGKPELSFSLLRKPYRNEKLAQSIRSALQRPESNSVGMT